jgi:hypothetical protein
MLSSNIPLLNKKIAPGHIKITLLGGNYFLFYPLEKQMGCGVSSPHPILQSITEFDFGAV